MGSPPQSEASPYRVLGLSNSASRDDVKAAFREHAKKYHPDMDPSPAAAARFHEIQNAAEALLHGKPYTAHRDSAGARAPPSSKFHLNVDTMMRGRRFPLYFSAACIAGGCALFTGVMYQHMYYPMYNGRLFVPAQEETEPKQPNEQQRLMNEMLAQKLDEVKAKQMREQQG